MNRYYRTMTIYYGCAPEKVKELKSEIFAIIQDLITNGPKKEEVDKAREKLKRERETNLRENNFWQSTLKSYYQNMNGDFKSFLDFDPVTTNLNQKSLQTEAMRIFDFKNYFSVTLVPEETMKEK